MEILPFHAGMRKQETMRMALQILYTYEYALRFLLCFIRDVHSNVFFAINGAIMASVHFGKEASIPGYQVHALTFDDTAGIWWRLYCLVVQDTTGNWDIGGCSGIAGNDAFSRPSSSRPKITLSGASNGHFY